MNLTAGETVHRLGIDTGKANAIGPEFLARLDAALDDLDRLPPGPLVITGTERHFSAGLDLVRLHAIDREAMRSFMADFHAVMLRVLVLPRPVIASLSGHAIAGGCVLALMADRRIAGDTDFRIGLREAALGVGLPEVVTEVIRFRLPAPAWVPVALQGQLFPPTRALEMGLVDEVVPAAALAERTREAAMRAADVAPAAWAQIKAGLLGPAVARLERLTPADLDPWLDTWFSDAARDQREAALASLGGR